jgi:hypothetical protein
VFDEQNGILLLLYRSTFKTKQIPIKENKKIACANEGFFPPQYSKIVYTHRVRCSSSVLVGFYFVIVVSLKKYERGSWY